MIGMRKGGVFERRDDWLEEGREEGLEEGREG